MQLGSLKRLWGFMGMFGLLAAAHFQPNDLYLKQVIRSNSVGSSLLLRQNAFSLLSVSIDRLQPQGPFTYKGGEFELAPKTASHLLLALSPEMSNLQDFSLALTARLDEVQGEGESLHNIFYLANHNPQGPPLASLWYNSKTNQLHLSYQNREEAGPKGKNIALHDGEAQQWQHYALTYSRQYSRIRFYQNGRLLFEDRLKLKGRKRIQTIVFSRGTFPETGAGMTLRNLAMFKGEIEPEQVALAAEANYQPWLGDQVHFISLYFGWWLVLSSSVLLLAGSILRTGILPDTMLLRSKINGVIEYIIKQPSFALRCILGIVFVSAAICLLFLHWGQLELQGSLLFASTRPKILILQKSPEGKGIRSSLLALQAPGAEVAGKVQLLAGNQSCFIWKAGRVLNKLDDFAIAMNLQLSAQQPKEFDYHNIFYIGEHANPEYPRISLWYNQPGNKLHFSLAAAGGYHQHFDIPLQPENAAQPNRLILNYSLTQRRVEFYWNGALALSAPLQTKFQIPATFWAVSSGLAPSSGAAMSVSQLVLFEGTLTGQEVDKVFAGNLAPWMPGFTAESDIWKFAATAATGVFGLVLLWPGRKRKQG